MTEIWRPAMGYSNYEISDHGRVKRVTGGRGVRAGRVLRPTPHKRGYKLVSLFQDGVGTKRSIHTLVWEAFHGARPIGLEVNHRDGNKANNRLDNLELLTSSGNKLHASANGLAAIGLRNASTKLLASDVTSICAALASGDSQRAVAARFGISQAHVSRIWTGQARSQVTGKVAS